MDNKKMWLKVAAGFSFFMAACQTYISLSPSAAAYFGAPPALQQDRWQLLLWGEAAALVLVVFGLYALSGVGILRRLPLLLLGLIGISLLFLLRGAFLILDALILLGILEGELLAQGTISSLVFLGAGIAYAVGTILNWKDLRAAR